MAGNTKEIILEKALDMFSAKGYAGTNLRELAAEVGITKAALYKHFKSKEDIWNSTMEYYDNHYFRRGGNSKYISVPETLDEFKTLSLQMIEMTINDPMIIKGRKLLTIEQYRNEKTAADATDRFFTMNLNRFKALLAGMIKNGLIKNTDIDMLALAYSAPVAALIQVCDREPGKKEYAMKTAEEYIDYFISVFGKADN